MYVSNKHVCFASKLGVRIKVSVSNIEKVEKRLAGFFFPTAIELMMKENSPDKNVFLATLINREKTIRILNQVIHGEEVAAEDYHDDASSPPSPPLKHKPDPPAPAAPGPSVPKNKSSIPPPVGKDPCKT